MKSIFSPFVVAWNRWKKIAEKIGEFQARLVFSLLYFVIITPVGFISSFFNDYYKSSSFPEWDDTSIVLDKISEMKKQ